MQAKQFYGLKYTQHYIYVYIYTDTQYDCIPVILSTHCNFLQLLVLIVYDSIIHERIIPQYCR